MDVSRPDETLLKRQTVWRDACAGALATVPMTIFMLTTQRFLPGEQRYALPPEIITRDLAHRVHIKPFLNKKQIRVATLFAHFGYGSAMGVVYHFVWRWLPGREKRRVLAPLQGLLYGFAVWAGSYLGLLPLLRISASGQREPGRRNLMMIAAHEVWGAALGIASNLLTIKHNGGAHKSSSSLE